jgi:hypothetical protein
MSNQHEPPYVASGRPDPSPMADRTGWHKPLPQSPPQPTFWPMVMALAITIAMSGIVLDYIVMGVGVALFAVACGGWIGDMLRE